jgi:hypothetical protein
MFIFLIQKPIFQMKKITNLLFLLLVFSQISVAQITLTSANAPAARTGHRTRDMDTTAAKRFNIGAAGASQTWNFSTVALDPAPAVLTTFVGTAGAPGASSFPTATLIQRQGLTNAKGIDYHRINASEWVVLGDVDSTGQITVSQDPQTIFKYPFTINSTFKDTFYLDDPDFGVLEARTTTTGDAWGTIQLSDGISNALRVKRVNTLSFAFFGVPVAINVTRNEWWTAQRTAPVVSHTRTIVTSALIPGSGTDTSYEGTILTAQTVGTQEVEVNHIANAYPSPANNSMTLDIDVPATSKVVAIIVSTAGQTIKTRNLGDLQMGKQQVNFDVTDLPSGSYQIILLSDKGKLGNQKIVVTH